MLWTALRLAVITLALCGAGLSARAAYPDRPITLIVPFAPGGPSDIIARILATALSQSLGQQVIVDNRGGGGGNVGIGIVARASPDGYTLLLTSTAIAVNTALFKNLPYDPFKDFVPISELVAAPGGFTSLMLLDKYSSFLRWLRHRRRTSLLPFLRGRLGYGALRSRTFTPTWAMRA